MRSDRGVDGAKESLVRRRGADWADQPQVMWVVQLFWWSNSFRIGTVSKVYRNIDSYARYRVRQWLCAKFKEQGQGKRRFSDQYLHEKLRLHQLQRPNCQRFVGDRV